MSLWSLAANYLTGGLAGAINTAQQNAMTREQMEWQSAENQKNRDFSKSLYELQRDDYLENFPELQKMQSDAQFNLWKNQFSEQNAYNSPQAQVARSLVAGQNPSGQSGMVQASNNNMSASQMSPPPQIHGSPLGGTASPIGIPSVLGTDLLREVGQFARNMADARNKDKQTARYDEFVNSQLEKWKAETDNVEEATRYQQILTAIKQVYGNTEAMYNNAKLLADAYDAQSHGDFNKANSLLAEADKNLSESKKAEIDERIPWIKGEMQTQIDLNKAYARKSREDAYLASQQADYYKAITKTENDLRSNRLEAVSLENDLRTVNKFYMANELKISDATMQAQINSIIEGMKQQQIITSQQAEKLYQLSVTSAWASRNAYMQYWTGFLNSASNVIGSSSGYYNGALSRMSAKERNQIQREFNDIIDRHYNSPIQPHEVRGFGYQPAWQE